MRQFELLVLDVETGGLDPKTSALLSVSVLHYPSGDLFSSRVRVARGLLLDSRALEVNGFKREECTSLELPDEQEVLVKLQIWKMTHRGIVVGSNVKFDLDFIKAAQIRTHINPPLFDHRALDLHSLGLTAHLLGLIELPLKFGVPNPSLSSICKCLRLEVQTAIHTSNQDVELTLAATIKLLELFEKKS